MYLIMTTDYPVWLSLVANAKEKDVVILRLRALDFGTQQWITLSSALSSVSDWVVVMNEGNLFLT